MTHAIKRLSFAFVLLMPIAAIADSPQQIWDDQCAKCHGSSGDGKTKIGIKLQIKDYTDPKVQAAFSDAGLLKDLLLGVDADTSVNRMPAYKDKLTMAEAKEQVALIRSFKK